MYFVPIVAAYREREKGENDGEEKETSFSFWLLIDLWRSPRQGVSLIGKKPDVANKCSV